MFLKSVLKGTILLFLFSLIIIRYYLLLPKLNNNDRIKITAKVTTEPIRYKTSQYLKIKGLKIYLPKYPEIFYGDYLVVEGRYNKQKNSVENPKLIEHKINEGLLYQFRQLLVSFYKKALPEPHSSLIAGVTIGSKSEIPEDFWEKMKKSGTVHIMVASGFNLTLVAGFLVSFLILFMSRKNAVMAALIGIWIYALISGFDAPVIRAAIMSSCAFLAVGLGRVNFAWRSLFVSVIAMLLIWPLWLTDLGFILSFSATSSLMLFGEIVKKAVSILKVPSGIGEGLYTSLAAQILVAPILFVTFGYLSIWSPLINAAILWTIPIITSLGIIAGLAGVVCFELGKIILFCIYPLTSYIVWIISIV